MFKNILLIISGGVIIYLLKNKQTANKKVEIPTTHTCKKNSLFQSSAE